MIKIFYIVILSLVTSYSISASINTSTYIPNQAYKYFETIKNESNRLLPEVVHYYYFAALIEHESCISLTHKRCWNPSSQLKTSREEGAGLSQLTRAYKTNGDIRFDIINDLRKQHNNELRELSWNNVYQRPDLQIRAMILLSRNNYKSLHMVVNSMERLAMSDAAYNGGLGGLSKERTACGLAKNCNPQIWFNNIENYCLKSKKPLYGNRTACDINRHHVRDVIYTRMPKYKVVFDNYMTIKS